MTETTQRRTGRPPKITREQILDAAALFDPLELQLTTLAEQLGISVKTVYYYFPNRRELLDALTTRAVAELGEPQLDRCSTPSAVLRELAWWAFRLGERHPGWYFDTAGPRGVTLRVTRDYLGRMAELGIDDTISLRAYLVVANYALATGESVNRTLRMGGLSATNVRRHLAEYGDDAMVDRLTAMMADVDVEQLFEDGLAVVMSGVERELLGGPEKV
jgi:TetR/AcrR family transcriptional regulator, tetracycline repressor protein